MTLTTVNPALLDTQAQYTGFKNRIINGAMVIDQRNAGASVTPTGDQYTIDRWRFGISQSSKFSTQQNAGGVTPPAGFTNYLGVTSLSAYSITSTDIFGLYQRIEGYNIADLAWGTANASAVTISFKVYSSLTGTFSGSVQNSAGDRSYPFTYSIPAANTWTTISTTIPGDTTGTWLTNNSTGIKLTFGLGLGSTVTAAAGSWTGTTGLWGANGCTSVVGTSGATFYITGVQLEKGSTATSFDYRPYGTELALCQRYFQKWDGVTARKWMMIGMSLANVVTYGIYFLRVSMRTDPTLITSGTASDYCFYSGNTLFTCTSVPAIATSSVDTPYLDWRATGCGDGRATGMGSNTNNGSLSFNAEL